MRKNIFVALASLLISSALCAKVNFTILHTNDLHSYFDGVLENSDGSIVQRGTYSRLAWAVKNTRAEKLKSGDDFVLLLDAGDFYSGTLFHALAPRAEISDFPEYDFFRELSYDAITLGNHEFDAKDQGFYVMMDKISKRKVEVPVVSTNFKTPKDLSHIIRSSYLKEYKDAEGKSLMKIGFLGALGPNGCKVSKGMRQKLSFHGFSDQDNKERWSELYDLLKKESQQLKDEGADIIILMLHGGGEEDELIAREIPLIDVIIAGHTHEVYVKKVAETVVAQAGHYAKHLGVLPFQWDGQHLSLREEIKDGKFTLDIEEKFEKDPTIEAQIKDYQTKIDKILEDEGLPKSTNIAFRSKKELSKKFVFNSELGSFVTSKVKSSLNDHDPSIDLYFTTLGLIRTGLLKDYDYNTSEVFKILPLGFGENYKLGTPTVSFYLSRDEVRKLLEFLIIYSSFDKKFMPVFSDSLKVKIRPWGIPFINKISELSLNQKEFSEWPPLIHVSTNAFVFKYISFVNKKSLGLVELIPKDKNGQKLSQVRTYQGEFSELLSGLLKAAQ